MGFAVAKKIIIDRYSHRAEIKRFKKRESFYIWTLEGSIPCRLPFRYEIYIVNNCNIDGLSDTEKLCFVLWN